MKVSGTITALSVDYGALKSLVEAQTAAGVEGICSVGTSGESPTLSHEEHHKVIEKTIEYAGGKCLIVAGTGANSTSEAVSLTKAVIAMGGADASLQVTPYYNKPNAEGLYRHFMTIADLGLPIVLYNVPGRSGREIPVDVVARLAAHPNVVAIKEAAGSVDRVSAIKDAAPDFTVISGDDSLALPMISVGAEGVISVASNVIPREMGDMVRLARAGDFAAARAARKVLPPLPRPLHRRKPGDGQGGPRHDGQVREGVPPAALRDGRRQARATSRHSRGPRVCSGERLTP